MNRESNKFLDAFKRAGKPVAEQSGNQSKEVAPTGPILEEILADRKQQELFGEFLEAEKGKTKELSQRLLRG